MSRQWETKRLGDWVASISTGPFGSLLHKSDYVEDGVPLVNPINISGERILIDRAKQISEATKRRLGAYVLEVGDIVVGRRGEIGRCAVVGPTEKGWICGTGCFFIRPSPATDSRFLAHLIRSSGYREKLERASTGTTMSNLSNTALADLEITVPLLTEQKRIVGILDEAFDGIATAKANTEKNLANARAVFEAAQAESFARLDTSRARRPFSDVCEITAALIDPRKPEYRDLLHIGGANIASKTGELGDLKTARDEGLISGKFVFDESMVIYSKIRPYLRKVARPAFSGLCSADVYPLSPKPGLLDRDFLFHLLLSPAFTEYANSGSARAGMPKVNRDHLFAFRFAFPTVKDQQRTAKKLDDLLGETQRLERIYTRKLSALSELKRSLLHQAFTGQL